MAQLDRPGAPDPLALDLDRDDDLSIGTHLGWRLRVLIQSGRLGSEAQLPSVRGLAAGAGVNVNTARAVYDRLEQQGLAISRQGRGTFVGPLVTVSPTLEQFAAEVTQSARAQGIDPRELARALYAGSPSDEVSTELWEPDADPELAPEVDRRAARQSLRAQIARLESQLATYPEPGAGSPRLRPRPHIADIGELEAMRDGLVEALKQRRAEAKRIGAGRSEARAHVEEMVDDPAAHRWESISREQTGDPGCGHWQVRPAWGPVGALMNWWRVRVSSGCPLAEPRWRRP